MANKGSSGGKVAEGLLIGALTGAALYFGWKTNKENKKMADTLLDVAAKERETDDGIDMTIRELSESMYRKSGDLVAAKLSNSTIWGNLLQFSEEERQNVLLNAVISLLSKHSHLKTKCYLTRTHRTEGDPVDILCQLFVNSIFGLDLVNAVVDNLSFNGRNEHIIERVKAFKTFLTHKRASVLAKLAYKPNDGVEIFCLLEKKDELGLRRELLNSVLREEKMKHDKTFALIACGSQEVEYMKKCGFEVSEEAPFQPESNPKLKDFPFQAIHIFFMVKSL